MPEFRADPVPPPDPEKVRVSGRRLGHEDSEKEGPASFSDAPTWRGWVVGLMAVAFLAAVTPAIEYQLGGLPIAGTSMRRYVSFDLLPVSALAVLLLLVALNALLQRFSKRLGLGARDLTLIAAMTMVSAALPAFGFTAYVFGAMSNASYYATPENQWSRLILPNMPAFLAPQDPADPNATGPRPIQWFMSGLPEGRAIPWAAWAAPFAWWALMAVCIFGMMFAVCNLLRRQWQDHERLPFPLAQIPQALIEGGNTADGKTLPFLRHPSALHGMGLAGLLMSWNYMAEIFPSWPAIPLYFSPSGYLREQPWSRFNPLFMSFSPAVVGLTFLLPIDVSFSLWFFYLGVMKSAILIACHLGLGEEGWDFYEPGGHRGFIINQGNGALYAMVIVGLWLARKHLADVFRRAWRPKASDQAAEDEALSPRETLVIFGVCFAGATAWLMAAGFSLPLAIFGLLVLMAIVTGIMRISCEGGLYDIQSWTCPYDALTMVLTPAGMGARPLVVLGMWSRVFTFDWGRTSPMPAMMNGLKLAGEMRLRRRAIAWAVAAALALSLVVSFVSTLETVFHHPGGANGLRNSWGMNGASQADFATSASAIAASEAWQAKQAKYAAENREPPESEVPAVAKRDRLRFFWMGVGATALVALTLARTYVFWLPHPIGYVMWMHPRPMQHLWFGILLGWFFKWAVLKYGGHRVYQSARMFFIGLVVGEVAAAGIFIVILKLLGQY